MNIIYNNETYYPIAVSNIYRTKDGTKIIYMDYNGKIIQLYSDTAIHVEARISKVDFEQKESNEDYYNGELYDADPNCKHVFDKNCMSGVRCIKCGGWNCL